MVLVLLMTVLASTASAGHTVIAAAADPIDVPMTGILPACPGQMYSFGPSDVWVDDDLYNQFGTAAELGLKNNCAMQNWQDPDNTSSFPRGVDAKAVPDTISISSEPVTVSVQADSLTMPGPYNNYGPECMPRSTRPGGCSTDAGYFVGYRLANGAGEFVGRWTLAGVNEPNPYFDMTRGSCPDNYPAWSEGYEDDGIPCTWTVHFVTTAQGAPVLTSAMQVVLATSLRSGTQTSGEITGPEHDMTAVVPMLFQPGASIALGLRTSASSVRSGGPLTLTATARGPAPGTPVNFYRRLSGGGWDYLGQATTNAQDKAVLAIKVATTATYRARLVSNGTETVTSPERQVIALRKVSLLLEHLRRALYRFSGEVSPVAGAGEVKLQKLGAQGWRTVAHSPLDKGKVSWKRKVPDGSSSWRLLTKAGDDYGKSVSRVKEAHYSPAGPRP